MRFAACVALAAGLWAVAGAAPDDAKKAAGKKSGAKKTAVKKSTARKSTAKKSAASRKGAAKKKTSSWRSGQMKPTPERYREIQDALARKGFLEGPGTGTWDAVSVEALKRFQAGQGLKADGKIDSLSLIALGLGPKRETLAQARP